MAKREEKQASADEILDIASAAKLGIVQRWDCGCAEVNDAGVIREQPDMFCNGVEATGHKARVVQGRSKVEEDRQGRLF